VKSQCMPLSLTLSHAGEKVQIHKLVHETRYKVDTGMELYFAIFATTAGWCGVASSAAGLRLTVLPRPERREAELQIIRAAGGAVPAPERFTDFMRRFKAYFDGRVVGFPDALDLAGATVFQQDVWRAARLIPRGETRSYAWLAGRIGRPQAARAVGQALGRNPLPVVVPCHRVLAAGGGLGGFRDGLAMKRHLLRLEASAPAG
jgi:methylated-DNA-[protein]-cysteine S-methyltransferase